jgi:hypothetical protein
MPNKRINVMAALPPNPLSNSSLNHQVKGF